MRTNNTNNTKVNINISEKEIIVLVMTVIICITLCTIFGINRVPTPYESFNEQLSKCKNNLECRSQVIGFYEQSINDIEQLESERKFAKKSDK